MDESISQTAIKLALEQTYEGLQLIDRNWRYVYINAASAKQGGKTPEELLGRTMIECFPGIENTLFFKDLKHVMEKREARTFENEFEFPDGSKKWFELHLEPYTDGVLIRSIDISQRKNIEAQLRHAQKMDAVGRLAGGIAHDFNNKLAVMMAYCEMAINHSEDRTQQKIYLNKVLDAVHTAAALTRQLLAFSRRQVLDLKMLCLNELLAGNTLGLNKLVGENISIQYELAPDLYNVQVDPSQMDQVILNLTINARDAMPQGGKLLIETKNVELDEIYTRSLPHLSPGSYVLLSVTDTGHGMSPEVLDKIFEPFFTTKVGDKGTGLGLPSVHGIIHQSRGHIWVYSELGKGTAFKIYLPAFKDKVAHISPASEATPSRGGGETLLLVEDDQVLRDAYQLALKNAGYDLITMPNAEAAIQAYKTARKPIQIVVTDLVLPGMNGAQLATELRKINPDLKVVYMSGYSENTISNQGILDDQAVLLQKPVSIREMLEVIRKVLDGKLTQGIS